MDVQLVVEKGSRRSHVFRMRSASLVIGRGKGCAVRVPSAAVSRKHCRLQWTDGFLTAEDLDSVNGTFLNGASVTDAVMVRPGDRLKVGPVTFVVEYELDQAALDRLAAWEAIRRGAESLDEFELVEQEVPAPGGRGDSDVPIQMSDSESDIALTLDEEEVGPDLFPFDNDAPMQLPEADQLREFLSQLEKPADE